MFERRLSISYRGGGAVVGGAVSFRHHQQPQPPPPLSSHPIIIGRSFGPFLRSASLQAKTQTDDDNYAETAHQIKGDCNKLAGADGARVTSKNATNSGERTQAATTAIDIQDKENGTAKLRLQESSIGGGAVTRIEQEQEINVRKNRLDGDTANKTRSMRTSTRAQATVALPSQYKILRRQFSMDQKQLGFQIKPSAAGCTTTTALTILNSSTGRWRDRRNRYESVDVISRGGGLVGEGIRNLIREEVKEDTVIECTKEVEDSASECSDKGVKDSTPVAATVVNKAPERDKNRINLNIVLRGHEDQEVVVGDGESQSGLGLSETARVSRHGPIGFSGKKVVDSKSTYRRAPLVRAMSAPAQNHNAYRGHLKKTLQPQPRRTGKTPLVKKETPAKPSFTSVPIKEDEDFTEEQRGNSNRKSSAKNRSTSTSTANASSRTTTFSCDHIVTLVSLLDSGGSDSEREKSPERGATEKFDENLNEKPPTLRKAGKSVSFQEHANQNYPAVSKEYSLMFRRGSVAPLAARIRAHRPPTAPPGSVFIRDIDTSESTSSAFRMARRPTVDATKTASSAKPDEGSLNPGLTDDPDALKTAKEKECLKLYQTMKNRGILVSYDTILRGMLTPTELRLIQKQRQLEQAQREAALEAEAAEKDKK